MRIEQLEYLVEISRRKSFNSASENLFLTPQSLSRSITSMETELGFKLFERNSRGVRFTPEGEKFLHAAQDMIERYRTVLKEIDQYRLSAETLCDSKLIMYAHPIFTMSVLPQAIAAFCREYPKISVCLLEEVSSGILEKLIEDDNADDHCFKLGLLTLPQMAEVMQKYYKEQEAWKFVPLLNGEYVCCVSKKSELAAKRNISLKTICQYPLVRFTNNLGDVSDVQSYFLNLYGATNVGFSTTSIGPWISAIENNVGVGLIHNVVLAQSSMIRDEFEKVAILPIREKTSLEAGLLVPRTSNHFIDVFVDFMQNYFGEIG